MEEELESVGASVGVLRTAMADMEEELERAQRPAMANLFERSHQLPKGGRSQYPWTTTKLIVECLVTCGSSEMVQFLMFTSAKTSDQLPHRKSF